MRVLSKKQTAAKRFRQREYYESEERKVVVVAAALLLELRNIPFYLKSEMFMKFDLIVIVF